VRNEALLQGKRRELEAITAEKDRLDGEITRLSSAAAKLEDLKKDHLLAEAVYSSALARVDTSKSDIYGAYPILQVLAAPNLPEGHEQPRRMYAFAGGVAATLFSLLTWGLAWLHYLQTTRRRKKRSSAG
jgi:capsule polysaccharide export protein KpsE/RkpR